MTTKKQALIPFQLLTVREKTKILDLNFYLHISLLFWIFSIELFIKTFAFNNTIDSQNYFAK